MGYLRCEIGLRDEYDRDRSMAKSFLGDMRGFRTVVGEILPCRCAVVGIPTAFICGSYGDFGGSCVSSRLVVRSQGLGGERSVNCWLATYVSGVF
jgi:hypothetical protein